MSRFALLVHSRLTSILAPNELNDFLAWIEQSCNAHRIRLRETKERKIDVLLEEKTNNVSNNKMENTYQFHPRIVNLSNVVFTEKKEQFFGKGMKFSFPSPKNESAE